MLLVECSGRYDHPFIELKVDGGEIDCQNQSATRAYNRYLKGVRRKYWHSLMYHKRLEEITGAMPSAMRDAYSNKVDEMSDCEFDEFNIQQLILDIQIQLRQGMETAILDLFKKFSVEHAYYPECKKNIWYYSGWKTNKAHKVGPKVIIPIYGAFANSWKGELLDQYEVYKILNDLEKVMDFLDKGKTTFHYNLSMEIERANAVKKPKVSGTYFDATFYKKGTCHIKFRPEAQHILDRLNIFAGKQYKWLPPFYGRMKYEDMDEEGRAVIDSFQGAEEYSKVVAAPNEYLIDSSTLGQMPLLMA